MSFHFNDCYDFEEGEFDLLKVILKRQYERDHLDPGPEMPKKQTPIFRSRKVYKKKDPKQTIWWEEYVLNEDGFWSDPNHRNFKIFEMRYGIDQPAFIDLVNTIKNLTPETGKFWNDKHPKSKPIELLILGSLRILTRNYTLDCLWEQTRISPNTHSRFFHGFVTWYAQYVYPELVKLPGATEDEVERNGWEYKLAGFPLCLGSIDVVHIRQWLLSANLIWNI